MIIIRQKEGESIERMLRRYKRKHKQLQISKEVREKAFYTKPSKQRRQALEKAKYANKMALEYM